MSSEPPQPNPGPQRNLNLQQMAGQFMAGVQRHLDMLAFNLAAHAGVKEEAYLAQNGQEGLCRLLPMQPNFEQLQAFARDVLLRQVVGDSTNLAISCLNNAHLFLALVKATGSAGAGAVPTEAQKEAQEAQDHFVRAPLDQKFNLLEEHYRVLCPLEDTITSLAMALQVLMRQGGVVKEAQLDESGELTIELQRVAASDADSATPWFEKLESEAKVFRDGQKVAFSDAELQRVLFTLAVFAHQLFTSVARYAREQQDDGHAE